MNTELIQKIKKLMALAEGEANPHESHSALLLARKLMAQNGLSAQTLRESESPTEVVEGTESMGKRRNMQWARLAGILSRNFPVEIWWTSDLGAKHIVFCGLPKDVEITQAIFQGARDTANALGKAYASALRAQGKPGLKKIFVNGFLDGLSKGFDAQTSENPEWGLVLHTPAAVLDYMQDKTFVRPPTSRPNQKGVYDAQAYKAGRKQGHDFATTQNQNPEITP